MFFLALYFKFQHSILTYSYIYIRIAIVFFMLPVLGEKVLSNLIVKNVIVTLIILGLWPCFQNIINPEQGWIMIIISESIVGIMLAFSLCVPFWVVIGIGEILDNQRGATISDSIDPVNGVQSSILSSFLNFSFGAIFFTSGGMKRLIEIVVQSYQLFPIGQSLNNIHFEYVGDLLILMIKSSILLSSPVMIVLMISELLLGVFARYCPQLNPFSLSLTIKSFIAFSIFIFYGFNALTEKPLHLFSVSYFKQFIQ